MPSVRNNFFLKIFEQYTLKINNTIKIQGLPHAWTFMALHSLWHITQAQYRVCHKFLYIHTRVYFRIMWYKNFLQSWVKDMCLSFISKLQEMSVCCTRWFKYDRDWFVCKQAALRSSCATFREWSHNLHPPSCSG